jgi:hypothetical protein
MAAIPKRRLARDFNLGGEQAEADPLLDRAFYESGVYTALESQTNPHCFVIGRTGSGKSAVLQRLYDTTPKHVIRIDPENLSLPYIIDLGVMKYLRDLGVHLDPLFIALWKHVLLVELIRHRYNVDSPEAKSNFLATLRERIKRDSSKAAALDYLEEFGERFWCETDERVREVTENFEKNIGWKIEGQAQLPGVGVGASTGISGDKHSQTSTRSEEAERFQRIVNATQLPRLNKMITVLDDEILDSSQHFTYVVIDDLDRDWVDDQLANDLIRCLFRAVLDLQKVRHLKIIVALRTNIFAHLNFGARTGGQEEKFRALRLEMRWTPTELRGLADVRARVAAEISAASGISSIADLLPAKTARRGDPFDFIVDRTLHRPRDVIAFLNEALPLATGKSRLAWGDLTAAERQYSENRLLALRDEWKPTFTDIDKLFQVFRSAPPEVNRDEFTEYLDRAALLPADTNFAGVVWMTELTEPLWSGLGGAEWEEMYSPLTQMLYDIGLFGIREPSKKPHYSYETPGYADLPSHLHAGVRFVVHPAFRPALDVAPPRD